MRFAELLQQAGRSLLAAGVEEYETDARLLLEHCSGLSRTSLYLRGAEEVPRAVEQSYRQLLARRIAREPVAYIVGQREFWSMAIEVTPAVLIPRPETEFLLDRALALATRDNLEHGLLLDLCCGSGVIALVLAKETGRHVIASDISMPALQVAKKNIGNHGAGAQVFFVQSDLFTGFHPEPGFSLIVSNPPYVTTGDVRSGLAPEVANHEPHLALDGGGDGLDVVRRILADLPQFLRPGGQLFLEFGAEQGDALRATLEEKQRQGLDVAEATILTDYAGRDRILSLTLGN